MLFKATEIMFLLGLTFFSAGVAEQFGLGWSLMAVGAILLLAAFRNAAEREKGDQ